MYFYLFPHRKTQINHHANAKKFAICALSFVYLSCHILATGNSLQSNRKSWERKVLLSLGIKSQRCIAMYIYLLVAFGTGSAAGGVCQMPSLRWIAQTHRSFYWQSGWLTYFLAWRKEVRLLCIASSSPLFLRILRSHRI